MPMYFPFIIFFYVMPAKQISSTKIVQASGNSSSPSQKITDHRMGWAGPSKNQAGPAGRQGRPGPLDITTVPPWLRPVVRFHWFQAQPKIFFFSLTGEKMRVQKFYNSIAFIMHFLFNALSDFNVMRRSRLFHLILLWMV